MAAPLPGPGGNTGSGGADVSSGPLSPLHPASPIARGAQASEQQRRERVSWNVVSWRFFRSLGALAVRQRVAVQFLGVKGLARAVAERTTFRG